MWILAGVLLALAATFLVLQPILQVSAGRVVTEPVPLFSDSDDEDDPALERRDRALAALKEIDFDRATGKLSDADYEQLKAQFTVEALDAMKAVDLAGESPSRQVAKSPDADAVEALIAAARMPTSSARRFCLECGTPLEAGKKFCLQCGAPAGALLP